LLKLLPKGTHDYEKFIQPAELDEWGRQARLILQDLTGMQYSPFAQTFTLGGSVDVNYLAHFKCP
jgi:2-polyprenyl-6-hydroxyphenyl methylase/3-demethylubiquinone-9 3-methyltransferase